MQLTSVGVAPSIAGGSLQFYGGRGEELGEQSLVGGDGYVRILCRAVGHRRLEAAVDVDCVADRRCLCG